MTWHERNKPFSGKSIAQIAQQQGQGIMDTFLDIALADELRTSFQVIDRNTDPEAQANSRLTLHGHRHYRWRRAAG